MQEMRIDRAACIAVLVITSCGNREGQIEPVELPLENCIIVPVTSIGSIQYKYYDTSGPLLPGVIDCSDDFIFLGACGDSTIGGVSAYNWEGDSIWSVEYGPYGYALGICVDGDRLLFSVFEEIASVDQRTGEMLEPISVAGLSDITMLPNLPGESMPYIKVAQGIETNNGYLLWNDTEDMLRFSYCGYLTDFNCSFQRYIRIIQCEDGWSLGMSDGHSYYYDMYEVPTTNDYTYMPIVSDLALTDSSIVVPLSYRDVILELTYDGSLTRATYMGHELEGPLDFIYGGRATSTRRYLIADLDTDEKGNIYVLYSGYGIDQNGHGEIWRINTVSLKAQIAELNHSAVAFSLSGNRVAVVEQEYESIAEDSILFIGNPAIRLYTIDWQP